MFCHCVLLDAAVASWEDFSCVFCFISLMIVSNLSGLFVCFEVWFLFLLVGQLFCCRVFSGVSGPTERQLSVKEFYCSSCFFYCLSCGLFF